MLGESNMVKQREKRENYSVKNTKWSECKKKHRKKWNKNKPNYEDKAWKREYVDRGAIHKIIKAHTHKLQWQNLF